VPMSSVGEGAAMTFRHHDRPAGANYRNKALLPSRGANITPEVGREGNAKQRAST
jgi:hypothetical protein